MAISYGQFTLWVSVSYVVKSEHSCTSHMPRASYQIWLVRGDLQHEICPHAAPQSYVDIEGNIQLTAESTKNIVKNCKSTLLSIHLYIFCRGGRRRSVC